MAVRRPALQLPIRDTEIEYRSGARDRDGTPALHVVPAPRRQRFRSHDPEELSALLSSPTSPIQVETIGNEPFSWSVEIVPAGPVSLVMGRYCGHVVCHRLAPSNKVLFYLPFAGSARIRSGTREIVSTTRTAAIVDCPDVGTTEVRDGREHICLVFEREPLRRRLARLLDRPAVDDLDLRPEIDLDRGAGVVLQGLARTIREDLVAGQGLLAASPLALAGLADTLMTLVLENTSRRLATEASSPMRAAVPRHVAHAMEFMRAHLSDPISIEDIADACGVSIRTLQQGFRQHEATTPKAFLHRLRLEAAHADLCRGGRDVTVADIALRRGFSHLGRFAAEYRRQYGRLPSETLRSGE